MPMNIILKGQPINHFIGYAICQIQENKTTAKDELICLSMNENFLDYMNAKVEDLQNKNLIMPGYDVLSILKKKEKSHNPFFKKNDKKFRIDILQDSIIKNQVIITINDITPFIDSPSIELEDSIYQVRNNFKQLIQNSPMPMIVANEKGIIDCNKALMSLLGYDKLEEILSLGILGISTEKQLNGISSEEMFGETIQGAITHGSYSFEWCYKKKDGSLIISENTVNLSKVNGDLYFHCVVKDVTAIRLAQKKILEEHERMIDELSIPITPIFQKILLLPLIGALTEKRVRLVIESALEKIANTQSKVIILDVSSASDININIASDQFKKLSAATQLMGCVTILSGIPPKLAEGLINLNLDLSQILSVNNLQAALHQALLITGFEGIEKYK